MHFEIVLPENLFAGAVSSVAHQFAETLKEGGIWDKIHTPVNGCVVALSKHKRFHPCGIFLDVDGCIVFHCYNNTVSGFDVHSLSGLGFKKLSFYKFNGNRS